MLLLLVASAGADDCPEDALCHSPADPIMDGNLNLLQTGLSVHAAKPDHGSPSMPHTVTMTMPPLIPTTAPAADRIPGFQACMSNLAPSPECKKSVQPCADFAAGHPGQSRCDQYKECVRSKSSCEDEVKRCYIKFGEHSPFICMPTTTAMPTTTPTLVPTTTEHCAADCDFTAGSSADGFTCDDTRKLVAGCAKDCDAETKQMQLAESCGSNPPPCATDCPLAKISLGLPHRDNPYHPYSPCDDIKKWTASNGCAADCDDDTKRMAYAEFGCAGGTNTSSLLGTSQKKMWTWRTKPAQKKMWNWHLKPVRHEEVPKELQ